MVPIRKILLCVFVILCMTIYTEARGWKKYRGHCYILHRYKMNWYKAQRVCKQHGATLARIDNWRENAWMRKHLRALSWIDGTDLGQEGEWWWMSNGRHIGFSKWSGGQPDNHGGRQHCLTFNFIRPGSGLWDDVGCWANLPFICEKQRC